MRGRVERVVLRGQVAYENGKVVAAPGIGRSARRCADFVRTNCHDQFLLPPRNPRPAINSLLCVGLDPHPADLAAPTAAAARDFCLRLIEATADVAVAFKPNAAFFEQFGAEGMAALRDVIAAVPDEVPVLLDAKRGDIASTAEAYARAAFETLGADAITLSPYLGARQPGTVPG